MSNFPTTQTDDSWDHAAAESTHRIIRGTLLKFRNGNWSRGKEGTNLNEGTRLVALDTAAAWVKWSDGKPIEYRLRQPGHRLPDRDDLGDGDKRYWGTGGDGKPIDPWQNTRFVYFVDLATGEEYTFSTSTWGGRSAISDLADQIQRERYSRPGVVPVVELRAAQMLTKFGTKSKPFFKVINWRRTDEMNHKPNLFGTNTTAWGSP
jgi:hypothetical protein